MRARVASVNYGDHLAVTLPAWLRVCPPGSVTVVTSVEDTETQQVACDNGVPVFITDAWTRHDPSFAMPDHWNGLWRERGRKDRQPVMNKALALDEAFGFVGARTPRPAAGEVCLSFDADCLPHGELPDERDIAAGVLYGCRRYHGLPDLSRGSEMHLKGRICKSQHRNATCVGGGYFQMFRYEPGMRFGSYPGADGYDYDFAFTFQHGVQLESIHVVHFGEAERNWEGRKTPRFEPRVGA